MRRTRPYRTAASIATARTSKAAPGTLGARHDAPGTLGAGHGWNGMRIFVVLDISIP